MVRRVVAGSPSAAWRAAIPFTGADLILFPDVIA
jgi:hypothetical protein